MLLAVDYCQLSCFDTDASISVRLTCPENTLHAFATSAASSVPLQVSSAHEVCLVPVYIFCFLRRLPGKCILPALAG